MSKPAQPPRPPQTRTARLARARLRRAMMGLEAENATGLWRHVQEKAPEAWAWLEEDLDVAEETVKVTLRLDRSVVACFRAMGRGWQARANRVLATYVQMKIADVKRERREADAHAAYLQALKVGAEVDQWYARIRSELLTMEGIDAELIAESDHAMGWRREE